MSTNPSGKQFSIAAGGHSAIIVEVGGGVREYIVDAHHVLQSYPVDAMCDGAHGTPLIPWPNRLADGRFTFDGVEYRVPLSEPAKGNAIHGLLRWRSWEARQVAEDGVVMGTRLHPQKGYPFTLDVEVAYHLSESGLAVQTTATNLGGLPAPYGCGQHPYLSPGDVMIDECTLTLDASTRILTDDRQLPVGRESVEGTSFDLRTGRRIGDLRIDHAFTDLARDTEGRAWTRLARPDGTTAELWVDESYPIVEIYTADSLGPGRRRRGLGAEPMTMPPNGLQSGDGVIRLEPGESTSTQWGANLRSQARNAADQQLG